MDTEYFTGAQAAAHVDGARQFFSAGTLHVRPATIHQWVRRGHLRPVGIAEDGRTRLYRLADVARAERATRDRALRHAAALLTDTRQEPS
ncbi:MerR family transcriptional regulator [Streptomyces microflavus]|uniref:MerR family transcriptional regulator n=1 Tax=Streptomyces microflavus TaxID=1919 RepID=UPI0037FA6305